MGSGSSRHAPGTRRRALTLTHPNSNLTLTLAPGTWRRAAGAARALRHPLLSAECVAHRSAAHRSAPDLQAPTLTLTLP